MKVYETAEDIYWKYMKVYENMYDVVMKSYESIWK